MEILNLLIIRSIVKNSFVELIYYCKITRYNRETRSTARSVKSRLSDSITVTFQDTVLDLIRRQPP